ncbi:MAG: fasciclin domain-containing protein [Myxococcota bacterium]
MTRISSLGLSALIATFGLAACGDDEDNGTGTSGNGMGTADMGGGNGSTDMGGNGPGNIVEVATEAGTFNALLGLATNAGLAGTLSTETLTVFAPTDQAFVDLGIDPMVVSPDVITNVLLAHVVAGELDAAAVTGSTEIATLANISHPVGPTPDIRGAAIAMTDVEASNGIIHIMSDVIVPPTILETAGELGFTELATAIGAASMATQAAVAPNVLAGDSPITVFAPTNAAFMAADLTGQDLDSVLGLHVVAGQVLAADIMDGDTIETVTGAVLTAGVADGTVTLTDPSGATVTVGPADVRTLTGVIHVIDGVLLPQ